MLSVTCVNSGKEAIPIVRVVPVFSKQLLLAAPDFVALPTMVGGCRCTARFKLKAL